LSKKHFEVAAEANIALIVQVKARLFNATE